jgi:hypothetical protein
MTSWRPTGKREDSHLASAFSRRSLTEKELMTMSHNREAPLGPLLGVPDYGEGGGGEELWGWGPILTLSNIKKTPAGLGVGSFFI